VAYVEAALTRGCGWIDAVYFACAWRAAADPALLDEIADECAAFRASSELALESRQQGAAFLAVTRKAWPRPELEAFAAAGNAKPVAHAIAAAVACRAHSVPLAPALEAFLHGFAANLVSAAVRLVPLGQTDGQVALARLAPVITHIATAALTTDREDSR